MSLIYWDRLTRFLGELIHMNRSSGQCTVTKALAAWVRYKDEAGNVNRDFLAASVTYIYDANENAIEFSIDIGDKLASYQSFDAIEIYGVIRQSSISNDLNSSARSFGTPQDHLIAEISYDEISNKENVTIVLRFKITGS